MDDEIINIQGTSKSQYNMREIIYKSDKNMENTEDSNSGDSTQEPKIQYIKERTASKDTSCDAKVFARGKMPVEVFMNQELTTKDIHDTLWRCRDFELSHLWQRSVFLSAFLILCFTGYAYLLMKFVDCNSNYLLLHLFALILSSVAALFSAMWIMMGKGSKAWYEKYEHGITAFERNPKYADKEAREIGGFAFDKITDEQEGHPAKYYPVKLNNCLFRCAGGAYSPSRINIGIGQLSLVIWFIAILVHLIFLAVLLNDTFCGCTAFLIITFFVLVALFIMCKFPKCFHSETLEKESKNN